MGNLSELKEVGALLVDINTGSFTTFQ